MRPWLAALIAVTVPVVAAAQSPGLDSTTGLPLPSIGLPLPSLGLPHAATGLPRVEAPPPATNSPSSRRHRGDRAPIAYPLFVYPLPLVASPPAPAAAAPNVAPVQSTGRLIVDAPPDAVIQLYVDGYYVGTPSDYPEGIELTAGPHAVDLRAPGYDNISTSVRIPAGRSISYQAPSLRPSPAASTAGVVPAAARPATADVPAAPAVRDPVPEPTTFYFIPGCYMGNVAPADAGLPPGCDPAKAVAVRP